jgi:multidrug efflux pump subunit AcrA (membrane-fusion protein)
VNLERTRILSPVDGYVTNLLAQLGDYVNVGANTISLVDADSFWVDGYFEETNLSPIQVGDPAQIKLMGRDQIVRGHVDSIARAINVANAQPNNQGVATVNPIFTWVRLAQRDNSLVGSRNQLGGIRRTLRQTANDQTRFSVRFVERAGAAVSFAGMRSSQRPRVLIRSQRIVVFPC